MKSLIMAGILLITSLNCFASDPCEKLYSNLEAAIAQQQVSQDALSELEQEVIKTNHELGEALRKNKNAKYIWIPGAVVAGLVGVFTILTTYERIWWFGATPSELIGGALLNAIPAGLGYASYKRLKTTKEQVKVWQTSLTKIENSLDAAEERLENSEKTLRKLQASYQAMCL